MAEPLLELPLPFATLSVSPVGLGLSASLLLGFRALARAAVAAEADAVRVSRVYALTAVVALAAGHATERWLAGVGGVSPHGIHGGAVAAVAALGIVLLAWLEPHALRVLDRAAAAGLLGLALVRLGCHAVGCHAGRTLGAGAPSWLARLGTYPRQIEDGAVVGSPPFLRQLARGTVEITDRFSAPVHPAALYDAGLLVLAAGLVFVIARRRRPDGVCAALAAALGGASLAVGAAARGASVGPTLAAGLGLAALALGLGRVGPLRTARRPTSE